MKVELVHIGFGNIIAASRIVAITTPESAPIKRMIQDSRNGRTLIDLTHGRKTKAVIIVDSGHLILAAIQPETIASRLVHQREAEALAARQKEVDLSRDT